MENVEGWNQSRNLKSDNILPEAAAPVSLSTSFSNKSRPPLLKRKETASVSSLFPAWLSLFLRLTGTLMEDWGERTVMADRSRVDSS